MLDYISINTIYDGHVLKIDNRRLLKHFWILCRFLGGGGFLAFLLYTFLVTTRYEMTTYIAPAIIFLISLLIAVWKILQIPYHRLCFFDKKQQIYRIIEMTPFGNSETSGKLENIKELKIIVTEYESKESQSVSYGYQAFLILNDSLVYDGSNMIPLEDETGTSSNSTNVANATAAFLNIPFPEIKES